MIRIYYKIFALLILLFLNPLQGGISLKISPSIFERTVRRGEKFTFTANVENVGLKKLKFRGALSEFSLGENGTPQFGEGVSLRSCISWLDFDPKTVEIESGKNVDVVMTGTVPFNTSGGYYAALLINVIPETKQEANKIQINVTPGIIIAFTVRPGVRIDAELNSFDVANSYATTLFMVKISNSGNIHIRPTGSIVIFNDDGKIIDRLPLNENNFVLPNANRIFRFVWSDSDKRKPNEFYIAECRFYIAGIGKSLRLRKEFSTFKK